MQPLAATWDTAYLLLRGQGIDQLLRQLPLDGLCVACFKFLQRLDVLQTGKMPTAKGLQEQAQQMKGGQCNVHYAIQGSGKPHLLEPGGLRAALTAATILATCTASTVERAARML